MQDKHALAPTGSTGNNTHTGLEVGAGHEQVVVKFVVEAVGATPTVTYKVQGSIDGQDVSDANSHWFDLGYITDASDTIATSTRTRTTVGADILFVSNPVARRYTKFRLVTASNTNVTYRADLFRIAR